MSMITGRPANSFVFKSLAIHRKWIGTHYPADRGKNPPKLDTPYRFCDKNKRKSKNLTFIEPHLNVRAAGLVAGGSVQKADPMNDNGFIPFGLQAPAPDLLNALPGLARLQSSAPQYIARAESAQRLARRFAREEILPRAPGIDAACTKDPAYFDWELWRRANRLKLNIAPVPKEMGGLGWTALANALAVEEFTSACMGCASNITFNTFGLLGALVEFRADIVLKIIHQMVTAQRLEKPLFWSWAITEPSAGTDVEDGEAMATMQPSTEAERVEGGFRINGTKCFITNGSLADYVIATIPADTARPRESMATFLIPATSKGFSKGRIERKCGQKASQTAELFFQNV